MQAIIGCRRFTILFPDLLRPLTEMERARLRESILAKGAVKVPIVVDEHDGIIDGGNRAQIAEELGLDEIPTTIEEGLTLAEKRDLAEELNDSRRQQSEAEISERRRDRIQEAAEARAAGKSIRSIAEQQGVSIGQIQRDLAEAKGGVSGGETPQKNGPTKADKSGVSPPDTPQAAAPKTKGKDGKEYPSTKADKSGVSPPDTPQAAAPKTKGKDGPEVFTDGAGNEVPAVAAPAFAGLKNFLRVARLFDDLRHEVEALVKLPEGGAVHALTVTTQLATAKSSLWAAKPGWTCPYCGGKAPAKCEGCKGRGWVTKATYENK
jgi:ParB-like chromosome segregation protein Spo0J